MSILVRLGKETAVILMFLVTVFDRVLVKVFGRITGVQLDLLESSFSLLEGGKAEALPGGQRAATLHLDKASCQLTHYDRIRAREFCH